MIHSKTMHAFFLLAVGLSILPASAAVNDEATIGAWSLTSQVEAGIGGARTCVLTTDAGEGAELTVKLARDRWSLGLSRAQWPFGADTTIVATLNVGSARRLPIAIETRRRAEDFIAMPLPADARLPDLFAGATTVRIALEHQFHVDVSLAGFDKAAEALKACASRRGTSEASSRPEGRIAPETRATPDQKPDARIEGDADDQNDATIEIERNPPHARPRAPGIPKPSKPSDLIEANAPATPPVTQPASRSPEAVPVVAVAPAIPTPPTPAPVSVAVASPTPALDAAHASTTAMLGPAASGHDLVPMLMQAAKQTDFEVLADARPPVSLTRADTVFRLAGFTGATAAFEMPTAAASLNEVLARDRIACGGAYTAQIAPVAPDHADVMKATSRCEAAELVTVEHFLTLARKGGGFYVLAVSSAGPAGTAGLNPLRDVSAALDDAALAVTGRF